jgi:hypothetical protein
MNQIYRVMYMEGDEALNGLITSLSLNPPTLFIGSDIKCKGLESAPTTL